LYKVPTHKRIHQKINAKIPLIFQTAKFFVENISFSTTFFADTTLFLPKIATTLEVHVGQRRTMPIGFLQKVMSQALNTYSAQKEP
jgi:hypothetical protein